MSTVPAMNSLLQSNASQARYYRSSGRSVPCPCKTPEGFRDPEFHLSFPKYGLSAWSISPGVIPAGKKVKYQFIAVDAAGTPMSPAINSAEITDVANFQVTLTISWPDGGNFTGGKFNVYRFEDGNGPYQIASLPWKTVNQIVDNAPFQPGGTAPSPQPIPVLCNEAGEISNPLDFFVKAFVQPIQSTRATRLSTEYLQEVFGVIEADDHLGIFPVVWSGTRLDFRDWSQHGDDFVEYDGQRFFVVNANMIPDPGDGNPEHHWEIGLRVIRSDGLE